MTTGWVAGSVRATAMARRRLGTDQIDVIAANHLLSEAADMVARSPYGHDVRADASLAEVERGITASVAWNIRVLAGWLPSDGANMLRILAGWFEIVNIDDHIAGFVGGRAAPLPIHLGSLATAWPRLAATNSTAELRGVLATSAWGDPGSELPSAIAIHLRLIWADRVASSIPAARDLAAGGAGLWIANERFVLNRTLTPATTATASRLLGSRAVAATTFADFRAALTPSARWALSGVDDPDDMWQAEARWWVRLRDDGRALLATASFDARRPLGAVAAMAFDAWRTQAALEVCSHRGAGREVLDATR